MSGPDLGHAPTVGDETELGGETIEMRLWCVNTPRCVLVLLAVLVQGARLLADRQAGAVEPQVVVGRQQLKRRTFDRSGWQ